MIVFASTWDILGGQMGYNSLGNIFFFGAGMYICAVVQIGLYYDVGMYTSGARTTHIAFTTAQYFTGFAIGIVAAGVMAAILAVADVMDRVRTARALFRDRHTRRSGCGRRVGGLLAMGRRRFGRIDARISRRLRKRKSCFSISCCSRLPSSCCFFCGGSTRRISAWPSMRSATTRKRPKRWASTRAATNGRRGLSPRFSSASPAPFSAT